VVQRTILNVGGTSCGACVRHVTRALDRMTGVIRVDVDLEKTEALVEHLPEWVDELGLVAAVTDAGYRARVAASGIQSEVDPAASGSACSARCGWAP
jgi:copper chaperone